MSFIVIVSLQKMDAMDKLNKVPIRAAVSVDFIINLKKDCSKVHSSDESDGEEEEIDAEEEEVTEEEASEEQ